MNFKEWLLISEAIDANTKNLLAKQKAPQDQLDTFIKELEDEPTIIDNKTAFQRFQDKFLNKKEKPKDEDAQRKHFANIPNTTEEELQTYDYYKNENKESLRQMMEQLRKFIDKKLITIKIENKVPNLYRNTTQGSNKLDTPDFGRFTSQLDSIQGSLEQYKGKGNYFNPIEEELNHAEHRVAKGDNIWVFKGNRPNICRILGKNQRWCISSGTSAAHWFTYRISHHQTQYFVFDFNKDEDDPARYVNPGVAPQGMYSEWVDAENKHSPDPDARGDGSEVGINGYKSINEYKEYLVSKGIPLTTWTTTPPEDWEKRLHKYYELNQGEEGVYKGKSFAYAKNDEHPELFDLYLKIANRIEDHNFKTLTDDQKKEFLLGKNKITQEQFTYAIENFKGEYYNSLNLEKKILFAVKTNDQNLILKLAQNPNFRTNQDYQDVYEYLGKDFDETDAGRLLKASNNKDEVAKMIVKNQSHIDFMLITNLLKYVSNEEEFIDIILEKNKKLSETEINYLYIHSKEKYKALNKVLNRFSTEDEDGLRVFTTDEPSLTSNNITHIMNNTPDVDIEKTATLIFNKVHLSQEHTYILQLFLKEVSQKEKTRN